MSSFSASTRNSVIPNRAELAKVAGKSVLSPDGMRFDIYFPSNSN